MGSGPGPFSPTYSDIAKLPTHPSRRQSTESQGNFRREDRMMKRVIYDHNPYDPLDRMVWKIVTEQMVDIGLRRIDPPLSRNAEKVKSSGGGIGDQARYRFIFLLKDECQEKESKPMMCKLVLKHRGQHEEKVVVRNSGGWQELEMYLLDEQEKVLR
ncbi:uncharacterized protein MELLADRAFT_71489 [Melampsora larici-populina 98AG31]|uniref:GAR domain-containing protein n=1 Tax=Melampsora larici-populina (strain 98AG31 / pathotype 3-4-7) TaxID=747676 RepID=F4RGS5_MELLP|nr:uncharacterized protein MELLADRAFT_71489 [Melampsora larici-populina 98AG31]EGG08189.1 hypothetical protein MELLADRAFT_71489 [Melampsora larici-populina 98AG31]